MFVHVFKAKILALNVSIYVIIDDCCLLGCDAMQFDRLLLIYCLHLCTLKMEAAGSTKT
jgi:hypothetical protein